MKKYILTFVTILSTVLSCGSGGNSGAIDGQKEVSIDEFQIEADKLEKHYYNTVTFNYKRELEVNGEAQPTREETLEFHYERSTDEWIVDEGVYRHNNAFLPQTLSGMNMRETVDQRYDYTFYINPFKVFMKRYFTANESNGNTGYTSYEWKYDEFGYLIHVYSYTYSVSGLTISIYRITYTYEYK